MARDDTVTLDGYRIDFTTDLAVLVVHGKTGDKTWIPRSVCTDGGELKTGDTDIVVREWFAEKEALEC